MPGAFKFENFSGGERAKTAKSVPIETVEPQLAESYENGYKAGWEDATKSSERDNGRIGSDLASSLQSIAVEAEDARAQMLLSLQPLLEDMVGKVLPQAANDTLGRRVIEILQPMIDTTVGSTVQLVVNPDDRDDLLSLVETHVDVPVEVLSQDVVGNGQVFVRIGSAEKSVDFSEMLDEMRKAISAFYSQNSTESEDPVD